MRRRIKRFFLAGLKSYNEGEKSFSAAEEERSGESAPLRHAVKKPELAGSEKKERLVADGEDKKTPNVGRSGRGARKRRRGGESALRGGAERGKRKARERKGRSKSGQEKIRGRTSCGKREL